MDPNISPASGSASELSSTIDGLHGRAESHLAELHKAYGALDRLQPAYHEGKSDYEARAARVEGDASWAEAMAAELEREAMRTSAAIRKRLDAPESLGLSSSEWQAAGNLSGLAQSLIGGTSLADAVAALRGAIAANDRPRMAAFVAVAESRLRTQPAKGADGKVSLSAKEDELALRSLTGEAKSALRDRTLDPTRERLRKLAEVRSDLSGAVLRRRAAAELERQMKTGERVPWPRRNQTGQTEWYDRQAGEWSPKQPRS